MWLGEKVGRDATIEIAGRIHESGFDFKASFAGTIPLIDGKLNMQSISLEISFSGLDSSVKLECGMYWADPDILGTSQLKFSGKPAGSLLLFRYSAKLAQILRVSSLASFLPYPCIHMLSSFFHNLHIILNITSVASIFFV